MPLNFALIGAGGFVAPRHLQAIQESGHRLVAALDKNDSVGVLDRYFMDAAFFTEFERFDRHAEKLRRGDPDHRIHWVSVCSPNYLHDAHIRFALRIGADAICEKPLVLNPWNLDALAALEAESGRRICTVLQLRLHPAIRALKARIDQEGPGTIHEVDLTYLTARGPWYHVSWKGDASKSGGVAMNIGVHFFDMLQWIFGRALEVRVHFQDARRSAGYLDLEKARVRWFLSVDPDDLPASAREANQPAFRRLAVDGDVYEFSDGFTGLHTAVYQEVLAGGGYGVEDARPSVELAHRIRHATPAASDAKALVGFRQDLG
ncbi:Gfo/Idh/MocA family protein [Geothrix sp. PMB-07]|uniref:Gfo/Idh/MocA family oxidoreductase n=1 Tax=Geothrix sp. PMB-07 TaxID=3068640 RepID=UPI002741E4AC|nr:Gfo/Idh/MocA family oxidoreductase [Geothrix sp. PMB-07]WLT31801.1 Gfo/Idh/MocA family oxidoreductase [Geothrix sp. PMB-07]